VSVGRFARVSLYAADVLALGWWACDGFGPYAAARRVVFSLVAVGLVVPSALGPALARGWVEGAENARRLNHAVMCGLWGLALPAAVGLGLTGERWMSALFGPEYDSGGAWLGLVAARLPWLLGAAYAQAALVALRQERASVRLVLGQCALAAVLLPVAVVKSGAWGAGVALVLVEVAGAVGGWAMLFRAGAAPWWGAVVGRPFVGCMGLAAACRAFDGAPLTVVVAAAAVGYAASWAVAARWYSGRPGAETTWGAPRC
jgi:O-antigen/teichoic acid export membrane protein